MDERSSMNLKSSDSLKQEIDKEQGLTLCQVSIDCRKIDFKDLKSIHKKRD